MPIPVRLLTPAEEAQVSGGLADSRFFHPDDLKFVAANDRNVSGGVIPMRQLDFMRAITGGQTPALWTRYGQGITESGGLVSAWADQSGNGRDLLQATGTNQPTLDADSSILFDGVDNFMQVAFTLDQPVTRYSLNKQVAWSSASRLMDGGPSGAQVSLSQSGTTPRILTTAGSTSSVRSPALGTWFVAAECLNGAASSFQVVGGGTVETITTGDYGANNPTGLTVGAGRTGGSNFCNFAVKEIIVFHAAHDAATRARVIRYLAQVGGLSI